MSTETGKVFECEQCKKVFNRKENLTRHVKNHTSIKAHTCDNCQKSFTRSDLLRRHCRLHGRDGDSSSKMTKRPRTGSEHDEQRSTPDSRSAVNTAETDLQHVPIVTGAIDTQADQQLPTPAVISDDGQLDLNDLEMWSESILFDVPFAASWNDYAALSIDHITTLRDETEGAAQHHDLSSGAISRAPSPPNEASHEDKTPFAWSPSSKRIQEPKEVTLPRDDSLLQATDPRFLLSETRYERLKIGVSQELRLGDNVLLAPLQRLPTRQVIEAFLSRFFSAFLPQAPVIHVPTLDINELPDYLLAIMISIGATYSHRRNARRFAIVLQDWARCRLQLCIETDNALLRSSRTVYAAALICYSGLWCGNKRTFELAEAMFGSVVAWLRRLVSHSAQNAVHDYTPTEDPTVAWRDWTHHESQMRLQWMIYQLDCQYATLMNVQPIMALSEVLEWECPCDQEYWLAPSARHWKALLGRAVVPPSREFAMVIAPYLFDKSPVPYAGASNLWTAFLVLLTINTHALRQIENTQLLNKVTSMGLDEAQSGEVENAPDGLLHAASFRALDLWLQTNSFGHYADSPFKTSSWMLVALCRLRLHTSLRDLQDILGKSGLVGVQRGRANLGRNMCTALASVANAAGQIMTALNSCYDATGLLKKDDLSFAAPYSSVYIFLAHAFLYAVCTVATVEQKTRVLATLWQESATTLSPPISALVATTLSSDMLPNTAGRSILRHGAEMLSKLETWACSLNLALLLHWRSKL